MRFTEYNLPTESYIPGKTSRPESPPLSGENINPKNLSVDSPFENQFFLYGVDLFNHHFFWEAHEAWEEIWHLEEERELRDLLQGMIQLSGGFLKILQGNYRGARTLWAKARARLTPELLCETGVHLEPHLRMIDDDDTVVDFTIENTFHRITLRGVTPLL